MTLGHLLDTPVARHRTRGSAERIAERPAGHPQLELLWNIVAMIPAGEVWTYGEVARAAGLPGHARQAGFALKVAPRELDLPWHRVVSAGGRIAFPRAASAYREQVRRLRAEGVRIEAGRVVLPPK